MFESQLDQNLSLLGLRTWTPELHGILRERFSPEFHGDYARWQLALQQLPDVVASSIGLDEASVRVGDVGELTKDQMDTLEQSLRQLHPWRKGPFEIFGLKIDTEWRSDWKWERIKHDIKPLAGRNVLDIGCGSGYHCWRMRGAGANFVLGIDPTLLFVMQFNALQYYIRDPQVQVLPLAMEDLPQDPACFDTVFSMGLLYHRRDPRQHLAELKACLRNGGELVLETLVLDLASREVLIPDGRYARMRNVWNIPSVPMLVEWLEEAGFYDIRCVDVTVTTTREQRRTDWMQFQSLADYLDPQDRTKTVEGYPAPVRAVCIASK
ncbi:MAG: tRNA 5-methoxyuridine(34)/uridine 5-oxyacetic acid(34) synthase CmoB [Gammaproteobacteria bacterium]